MNSQILTFRQLTFSGTYSDARAHFDDFARYPALKREFTRNKQHLATNLGNIQTRLKTAGIKEYKPPDDVKLQVSAHSLAVTHGFKYSTQRFDSRFDRRWSKYGMT